MNLTIDELRALCAEMCNQLEKEWKIKEISFTPEENYYQTVFHEDRTIIKDTPIYFGDLDDDIETLINLVHTCPEDNAVLPYHFQCLGEVLRCWSSVMTTK